METVFTSHELLPKFRHILDASPHVKKIVYFETPLRKTDITGIFRKSLTIASFST